MHSASFSSPARINRRNPFTFESSYAGSPSLNDSTFAPKSLYQSFVLEEAQDHRVATFGTTLPVKVTEVLTSDQKGFASCSLDNSGWACCIHGRKLLAWRFAPSQNNKIISCLELPLCPTELIHSSSLTCLIAPDTTSSTSSSQTVSVVSMSPEGNTRYWPNLSTPGIFVEASAGLNGKEFSSIVAVVPFGCVAVTTTNELVLILPSKSKITCRILHSEGGMLSGFGRRMSSFWSSTSSILDSKHQPCLSVSSPVPNTTEKYLYALVGGNLLKWKFQSDGSEKMMYHCSLSNLIRNELCDISNIELDEIKQVQLCDVKATGYCLAILAALTIQNGDSTNICFALATVNSSRNDGPTSLDSLVLLKHTVRIEDEDDIPSKPQLIIPSGSYQAYIVTDEFIIANPVTEEAQSLIKIDFPKENNELVGGGYYASDPVFLSKRHGLVTLLVHQQHSIERVLSQEAPRESVIPEEAPDIQDGASLITDPNEALEVLQSAFKAHTTGKTAQSKLSISRLPSGKSLNSAVVELSRRLIDDMPMSDPRWATDSALINDSAADSVLIIRQLERKQLLHDSFIKFLQQNNKWNTLGDIAVKGNSKPVKIHICEHLEKLEAAIHLKESAGGSGSLLLTAIKRTIKERDNGSINPSLSPFDVFFQKVSMVHDIYPIMLSIEMEQIDLQLSPEERSEVAINTGAAFVNSLTNAQRYRQSFFSSHQCDPVSAGGFSLWTTSDNSSGVQKAIHEQILMIYNKMMPIVDSTRVGATLAQQAMDLSDLLLKGYLDQITYFERNNDKSSLPKIKEKYEAIRTQIVSPLVRYGYYELASSLAEKYLDFQSMIILCDEQNDDEKLEEYKLKYSDKGFGDVLLNHYMESGQWGKLMMQKSSRHLDSFLSSNDPLSWLHYISLGKYFKAYEILFLLAKKEKKFVARKKTMLSICKLCLLSSDASSNVLHESLRDLEYELQIIKSQETIPEIAMRAAEYDISKMPPMSPMEIVELYTGECNRTANEFDFKRALDLLPAFNADDQKRTWLMIWSRAILTNKGIYQIIKSSSSSCIQKAISWCQDGVIDPVSFVKDTVFFKCIQLVHQHGQSQAITLPRLNDLLESQTLLDENVCINPNFIYLMKACQEYLST